MKVGVGKRNVKAEGGWGSLSKREPQPECPSVTEEHPGQWSLTSVQSPHLSALPHVYHEYTIHSVSQSPVWVDNVLFHKRRETINAMRF